MKTVSDNQIERLLDDISLIKSTIGQDRNRIRQIMGPTHFNLLSLLVGVSAIGFSLAFYLLMEHYGSYSAIPYDCKSIVYCVIAADSIFLGIYKWKSWAKWLSKFNKRYTLDDVFEELFTFRIAHIYHPLWIGLTILCIFLVKRDAAYYIIPAISIGLGLLYTFIGSMTRLGRWLVSGYWFLVSGLFLLIHDPISVPFAVSASLGCGYIVFGVVGWYSLSSKNEAERR